MWQYVACVTCPGTCSKVGQLFVCKTPKNQIGLIWEHICPEPMTCPELKNISLTFLQFEKHQFSSVDMCKPEFDNYFKDTICNEDQEQNCISQIVIKNDTNNFKCKRYRKRTYIDEMLIRSFL